tara:strand:+ start:1155 stop:2153 length:999 start_codon:yes stop_codon:yes gene_type:complete
MRTLEKILINKKKYCKSIWFMRQAGRYLPEFRKIRSKNKDFIKLCLNSKLASKITLQPIKRYDLDSAIIFSDILMIPYALGQKVQFTKNYGPRLSNFNSEIFFNTNKKTFKKTLHPIYKAIKETRNKLDHKKSLISFVGAPWTLLVYMMGFKKKKNEINLKKIKNNKIILKKLIEYICQHIENQFRAGSNVVQIFDSWAGLLPKNQLLDFCYKPNQKIVNFCKKKRIPVICFPKGIGKNYLEFNKMVKPNGISLDYEVEPLWARKNLKNVVLQGGMNPKFLLKTDDVIQKEAKKYLDIFKDVPYIFNLGHGLVPETDPNNLEKLIKFVRNYK